MWDNGLIAPVTFLDVGSVEGGQEEIAVVVGMIKIKTPSLGCGLIGGRNRWAAVLKIESL